MNHGPSLSIQLIQFARRLNLTAYGISMLVAAETDPTKKQRQSCEKRWQRVLGGENFRVKDVEKDLNALGYRLRVEKVD